MVSVVTGSRTTDIKNPETVANTKEEREPLKNTAIHIQLEKGTKWEDLSYKQQEYILEQDKVAEEYFQNLRNSSEGEYVSLGKAHLASGKLRIIYHKKTVEGKLATVDRVPVISDRRKGDTFDSYLPESHTIDLWGLTLNDFKDENPANKSEGYLLPIRAGRDGLFDLLGHEHGHTFMVPPSLTLMDH